MNYKDFCTLAGGNTNYSLPCVSSKFCFNSGGLLLCMTWLVSPHICTDQLSVEDSRKTLWRSPGFSLCVALSSLVLCPMSFSLVTFTSQPHRVNSGWLSNSIWIPLSCAMAGNFLQTVSWRKYRAHLFSISQESLSSAAWYPMSKNHCLIYFIQL